MMTRSLTAGAGTDTSFPGFAFRGRWRQTTAAIDATAAILLVAWMAVDGGHPTAPTGNPYTWQALPVYAHPPDTHGPFFHAQNTRPGTQTFTASGS